MNKEFEKYGFTKIASFYSEEEVSYLSELIDTLQDSYSKQEGYYEESVHDESESILVRMEKILSLNNDLDIFFKDNRTQALLYECLKEDPALFKDKINFKMPGNRPDLLHQDQQAGWSEYAPYFITLCVCLDPNTSLNGCLQLPDTDTYVHQKRIFGTKEEPLILSDIPGLSLKEYTARPGDIFVFDSYVPHASNPNMSSEQRRNIYLTYNKHSSGNHHTEYYKDKYRSYPPNAYRDGDLKYEYKV